ncbi:MAG: hypothetical protein EB127_08785 [Alphaproteobacteria bacterium]|nr:hypothetical protein [Alphaproteobacteria bacterium]
MIELRAEDNKLKDVTIEISDQVDVVDSLFDIHLDQEILPLSTKYGRYYKATHKNSPRTYFAIVFERNFNVEIKMVEALKRGSDKVNQVVACNIVKLSKMRAKHLVAIVPSYDWNNNLEKFVQDNGPCQDEFVTKKLLPFLCSIIKFCSEFQVNCGNINPKNILIQDESILLREPLYTYPHGLQEHHFLAIEISDANISGRRLGNVSADVYAAGVTLLYCFTVEGFLNETKEQFKKTRLESGSLVALIGKRKLPDTVRSKVQFCVNDNATLRGNLEEFMQYMSDQQGPSAPDLRLVNDLPDIFAPVSFNGKNYDTHKSLAYGLFSEWDQGLNFLSEERVIKWIQRSAGKSKAIDALEELAGQGSKTIGSIVDRNDRLAKAIIALDPQGPIRLGDFSAHPQSFRDKIFEAEVNNNKNDTSIILNICLKNTWVGQLIYTSKEYVDTETTQALRSVELFYNPSLKTSGMERLLYHLNPTIPCLSPLVYNNYIISLRDLLIEIDKILGVSQDDSIFDSHILSFIAAKINLKKDMYSNTIKEIPSNADGMWMYYISMFAIAKKQAPDLELRNIALFFGRKISLFIEKELHNVEIKNNLLAQIREIADDGKLGEMITLTSNAKIYIKDQSGYLNALKEVAAINARINSLKTSMDDKKHLVFFGQRITLTVSYAFFVFLVIFMIFQ